MGGVGCGGRTWRGGAGPPYFPPISNQQWRTWSQVLGAPSLGAVRWRAGECTLGKRGEHTACIWRQSPGP